MENSISEIQKSMELGFDFISVNKAEDQWLPAFIHHINEMIAQDFNKLVTILYRLDVSESRLKQLLKDYPNSNAGKIIAELIIERQLQKIKSREAFRQNVDHINDNERW